MGFLLLSVLYEAAQAAEAALALAAFSGSAILLATIAVRVVWAWPVHPLSLGIVAAFAQTAGLGVATLLGVGDLTLAVLVIVPPVFYLICFRAVRRIEDESVLLPVLLRILLGILTVALLLRTFGGEDIEKIDDGFSLLGGVGPAVCLAVGLVYLPLRQEALAWTIWPAAGLIAAPVTAALESEGEAWWVIVAVVTVLSLVPALLWWLARIGYRNRRVFLGFLGAFRRARADAATDFFGGGAVQRLEGRRPLLWLDLLAFVVFAVLAGRGGTGNVSFNWTRGVEAASGNGYYFMALVILVSLGMRLVAKRRLRLPHVFVAVGLPAVVFTLGWLSLDARSDIWSQLGIKEEATLVYVLVLPAVLIASAIAILFRLRNVTFTRRGVVVTVMGIFGAMLADWLFTVFLGTSAFRRFYLGIPVGDVAAAVVLVAASLVYFRYRAERGAFIVWPAAAITAAILLRGMIGTQGLLNTLDARIATGWGEIFLAAIFGGLAGAGAILAKRVWIEKDPQARHDAVRVRGALLIVFAVWPILMLLFVAGAVNTFVADARKEAVVIAADAEVVRQSAETFAAAVSTASENARQQAQDLAALAEEFQLDLNTELEAIPRELGQIAIDAKEAGQKAATEIVDAATAKGAEIMGDLTRGIEDVFALPWPLSKLGIGSAISDFLGSVLEGIIPDFNLEKLFEDFTSQATTVIARQFAGPIGQAEEIKERLAAYAERYPARITAEMTRARRTADELLVEARAQFDISLARLESILVRVVNILYFTAVLLVMLVIALLAWLVWRAINGLFIIAERVARGWRMLTLAQEEDGSAAQPAPA